MTADVLSLFQRSGAYLRGHFLLTSGRHSDVYFEKFVLLQHPELLAELCELLARPFAEKEVATVMGPTLGGAIIAYELARKLGCRAIYAEPGDDGRVLRRGFQLAPGERVLLCDDILTTGRSVKEIIALAEKCQAEILGVALLLDRSGGEVPLAYPSETLAQVRAEAYDPTSCPLCKQGVPLTKRGSRQQVS